MSIDQADRALMDKKQAIRLPHFKYTGDSKVLMTVDVDMDAEVLIVGQPENGAYEWVIVSHGTVERHSDCGYGMCSIALRDGLVAYHGLSALHDAAPDLAEALRHALAYIGDLPGTKTDGLVASMRAALAKAGVHP